MRNLVKPDENAKDVFLNCLETIKEKNSELKYRLSEIAETVGTAAAAFEAHIRDHNLHSLPTNKVRKKTKFDRIIDGKVTVTEMKDVYDDCFVAKGSTGRALYDKIILSTPHRKCPYCFHRIVSTIDHYLPKAYFPLLSVVPINLVPSCGECNTGELRANYPTKPSEEILHPYFDNVENDWWLKARVEHTVPASVTFFVDPPAFWDTLKKNRVKNHFESLQLNKLYSIEAAYKLSTIESQCHENFENGGSLEVKKLLDETARSNKKANINSWLTALFIALSNDSWFCSGGFKIP